MKRLVYVLSGLLVLPAFAEVAPIYYQDAIEMSDTDITDAGDDVVAIDDTTSVQDNTSVNAVVEPRTVGRATASRAMASSAIRRGNVATTGTSSTRNLSTRASSGAGTVARTTSSRAATTRAGMTASRTAGAPGGADSATSRGVMTSRAASTGANTARSAAPVANTARVSIVQTDTVSKPLYNGRAGTTSAVRARVPTIRMATASTKVAESTAESKAEAVASMDELAQMSDFCKSQYTQCMDNFCNVLDDNQGRCSCSANLKNYAKTENALKEATESLQNVAQQIQYIGLSKDDINSLFDQTEAELAMTSAVDSSQLKSDLDRIKNMIVDVKGGTASVSTDNSLSFDLSGLLDFNISSTGFDLGSLFGTTSGADTSSISNQRGEQLYKTATARCKAAVLTSCQNQGVDISIITNSYDLEIDKQCVAYERSLSDANDQMASTVRNAKSVLQKARLMIAQQKNSYDLRGCVNALDSCMQDEFVCGSDYENCLDPTGKYIVNGAVVVGSKPGVSGGEISNQTEEATGVYGVWNYTYDTSSKGTAFGSGSVPAYVENSLYKDINSMKATTTNMAKYLQQKIGYVTADGKSIGMCVSILNKCQDYTYTSEKGGKKTYKPNNDVIRNYLERVSLQIKVAQDNVLTSYAETCISDVSACLSQNNYGNLSSITTEANKVSAVAVAACRPTIASCMSATGYGATIETEMYNWLATTLNTTVTGAYADVADIKNEVNCLIVRGTWNAGKCACGTGMKYNNSNSMCECTDSTKTWDESKKTCVESASDS